MFTGLVSDVGRVAAVSGDSKLKRIAIDCAYDPAGILIGASIACSGPCLTAVTVTPRDGGCTFEVDAAAETLARTTVGEWVPGRRVNLERSLKIGDELGGHLVTGHVDGLAEIVAREPVTAKVDDASQAGNSWAASERFVLRAPAGLSRFIAEKGSVCLDGTSLTVNGVEGDTFTVLLIPHTLAVTTWGERRAGDRLNLEVDLIARYAARLTEARATVGRS
ncbi:MULTISPECIES: riboflavin synthase [Methylobacterium]|uniref:riboflavin synthase n=1 Tax=Methylobacterium TaxID=407 RepID=UPI0013EBBFA1|nr:riboflavin synthase [Methylobacterium sp. DB0501]NGM35818.1 riboflavin synthase [Methylobacterium sp. DB0501]